MKKLNVLVVLGTMTMLGFNPSTFAKGDSVGNGGDNCEARIQNIASNIQEWILYGNHSSLDFKGMISKSEYEMGMLTALKLGRVSCTDKKLFVGKSEKTCKNYPEENFIECNFSKFMKTEDEGQYRLVHHEYAGLAGIETNNGDEASDYFLSDQVSGMLEWELVKRLPIQKKSKECKVYIKRNEKYTYGDSKNSLRHSIIDELEAKNYIPVMSIAEASFILEYKSKRSPVVKHGFGAYQEYNTVGSQLSFIQKSNQEVLYNEMVVEHIYPFFNSKEKASKDALEANLKGILPCNL